MNIEEFVYSLGYRVTPVSRIYYIRDQYDRL